MDFSSTGLVRLMEAKMNYQAERQDVLAQNVANADTPGYRAKDIAEPDFSAMIPNHHRLAMAQTSPEHKGGAYFMAPTYDPEQMRKSFEIKPVKNSINLEEQMENVSHNAFAYQMSTTLYKKSADLFRISVQNH
ncbi:flagellar basal body rod protein FlgB [bacterium]|nr:flagellar basal body rod protein FlgB [bacterium]